MAVEPSSPRSVQTRDRVLPERAQEVVDHAYALLDAEGADGLSMRRLADGLGVTAPALYRYFPDKRTLEDHITYAVLWHLGDIARERIARARVRGEQPAVALFTYYREWALEHPHLYRLVYTTPLDRERRDPAPVQHTIDAVHDACGGDRTLSRRMWVFTHGLVMLELDRRMTPGIDPEELMRDGLSRLLP